MKRVEVILVAALGAAAGGACSSKGSGAMGAGGSSGMGGALICNDGVAGANGAAGAPACSSNPSDYSFLFQDPCQPIEGRLTDLLAQLTTAEKQSLLGEDQPAIARLGLPGFTTFTEGIHGIGWSDNGKGSVSNLVGTQFPQAFGLAEAWDPLVMKTVGATTGYEARVHNAVSDLGRGPGLVVRAPLIDLERDPRWGRTEESYGEDPYLTAELAKGYLAGLHGDDPKYLLAASTLKHWLANNNEQNRETTSANVDERNLREYYAAPFEAAIKIGHAQGIMTAYNQLNGTPAGVSPLLQSLLVGEWGFDGLITTDATLPGILVNNQHYYGTLADSVAGLILGGTGTLVQQGLGPTIQMAEDNGQFNDSDLDNALRPVLRVRFRLGDLDPPTYVSYKKIASTETPWNDDASKAKALDATHESIVLLKNDAQALPLDATAIHNVAVIGPRGDSVVRDWYGGQAPYTVTPRQGITAKLPGANILYAADNTGGAAVTAAAAADVAVVFVGNHPTCGANAPWGTCPTPYDGREAVDRTFIELEPTQETLVESVFAANPRTIVVLVSSYPIAIGWINDHVPAVLHVTNSSQELGTAIADVLFGAYDPGGRTTTTWYRSEADIPTAITDYDIREGTTYWYFTGTPLYPFGYGLSYSTFAYANVTASADNLFATSTPTCGAVTIGVDVTNTGTVAGDEVAQLYVSYPGSALGRPIKQLRGFQRVSLDAGNTQHVTFALSAVDLRYWDTDNARYAVETGTVDIQIGASSADIRQHVSLAVHP
jgi:beta-glucosidase